MDRNEARKAAEVMLAYADGKEIEWSHQDGDGCWLRWVKIDSPKFDWISNDYRIKPQPKYRPFKDAEECWQEMQKHQPFGWIKASYGQFFVTGIRDTDASFGCSKGNWESYDYIFDEYTFADGEPFGVKEEDV